MISNNYASLSRYCFYTVVVSFISLQVIFVLSLLMFPSCGRSPSLFFTLFHVLPLLAFFPSVLKLQVRSYVWLCFILLGYFLVAVPNVMACTTWLSVMEVASIVVMFIAAMMFVRWRSRALNNTPE